jgi:DNA-binding CsgD family transcriptional regulator/Mrp family chromosome partitioning ATPase
MSRKPVAALWSRVESKNQAPPSPRVSRMADRSPAPDGARTTPEGRLTGPFPLVGRTRELAALESLLERRDEDPSVVIVSGEGGVGKSRLASELAGRAATRGWNVVSGRAYPVETGVPYALFSDAFLPVLQEMDPDTLTVLSRGGETELGYLFPALNTGKEMPNPPGGGEPEELRIRLKWNFVEFLKSYAARTPLLVVLEDLQWADESSLNLLHFIARQAAGQPLVLLCSYNDMERDRNPQLVQMERSLVSLGAGEVRRLEPLAHEHVTEFVARTFSVETALVKEFAALLYGWTRGNPFFLEETLKSVLASGRLTAEHGSWVGWDSEDFSLPGSIRDAVLSRLSHLSDDAQTVVELAAVIGARASYPLLESIGSLSQSALLSALEELCANRVLNEHGEDATVVYDFVHPLVRQTVYREFGLQRTRLMHGVVAEAMEAFYGGAAMEHADELAFHFARTDASRLRAKAARYLAAAGRAAMDRRADRESVNYLRAALERASDTPDGDGPSRADLLPDLARAHQHMGDFEAAVELWSAALRDTPPEHPEHARLCRTLGMAHFWCGRHSEAHVQLDAGLTAASAAHDDVELVRLHVAKGYCLHELGRGQEALDTLLPAIPIAERLNNPHALARVHRALALLYVWIGPPVEAREHAQRAIELAREVGDLSIEFWARWGLAVRGGMAGDTGQMAEAIDELDQLASAARSPVLKLWTADMAIELAYGRGDWDAGLAMGEQAITLARALNQRTLLPRILVWTSLFYVGRGELERAQALVDEAVDVSGMKREDGQIDVHQVVPACIGLAYYLVGVGDYRGAIEAAEEGLRIAEGTGYILWGLHRLLPTLVEACLWAGEIDRAQAVGARMREHAAKLDHKLGFAWADACDALVCWKKGDPERAVGLMRQAATALEEIPMIPDAARVRRQMAGRMAEIGDTDGAHEELKRLHDVFSHLGSGLELEKTRTMFREIERRPPPRGAGEGAAGLTPRELEVALLVAQRKSNKAIGKELNMATRTASTHLSNIYQKLGLGSRGELADYVRRQGLLTD